MSRSSGLTPAVAGLALLPVEPAWTQTAGDAIGYGSHMMWGEGGWSMMFFGPVFMIVILAATIAAVVLLVRWLGGIPAGTPQFPQARTPLDILKDRFAKGEIDKNEFEDRRRVLGD